MSLGDPGFGEKVEPRPGEGLEVHPELTAPCIRLTCPTRRVLTSKVRPGSRRGGSGHRYCPPRTTSLLPQEYFIFDPSAEAEIRGH